MKIALQESLLPGESLSEKLDFAEELAIEGLEVGGRSRLYDQIETYEQALKGRSIVIASVCGQETFDWLDPDPAKREIASMKPVDNWPPAATSKQSARS